VKMIPLNRYKKNIRKALVKGLIDFRRGDFWISFHLLDLINVWKRTGVNWKVKLAPKNQRGGQYWFHWWTPVWHEERGPYITMGIHRLRFYRGY